MSIVFSGLLLGLMGSFHCAGMCGPIALSLPLGRQNIWTKIAGGLAYNLGRTLTYAAMGLIFGLLGQGLQLAGFQRRVSILMGSLMILSILLPSLFKRVNNPLGFSLFSSLNSAIRKLFSQRSPAGLLALGLLNGLLPCGLVYLAIAGAIGTGSAVEGTLFMFLFGLGTLPMLLFISLAGNMMGTAFRLKINRLIPFVVVLVGLIFVLRGLNLGIPLLSPPEKKLHPVIHMQQPIDAKAVKGSCCHPANDDKK